MSIQYHPLSEGCYPKVAIEKCTAAPMHGKGGSLTTRVRFLDPDVDTEMYRIPVSIGRSVWCSKQFHRFTVLEKGEEKIVWLNKRSLESRFGVSFEVLRGASFKDDLMGIVRAIRFIQNPKEAHAAAKDGVGLHFSAKHYSLKEPMYVTSDLIAYGIKKSFIRRGNFARIKKARTDNGEIIVRRICVVTAENRADIERNISALQKLRGKTGIIDLLGVIRYTSLKGKQKVVTLHPLADGDFFDFLVDEKRVIPKREQYSLACQLLRALQLLDGAHGDLKPENILLKGDKLLLTDFDFYRGKEVKGPYIDGTPGWVAPEVFQGGVIITEKLDVWAAGIILCYLFQESRGNDKEMFPWQGQETPAKIFRAVTQNAITRTLDLSQLSMVERDLIEHMIVIDPAKRYTVDEAMKHFRGAIYDPFLLAPSQ